MATYGGGTTLASTKSFIDQIVAASSVVYTVPTANNYADFKLLSLSVITGTGVTNTSDIVISLQNDDGVGGYVTQAQVTTSMTYGTFQSPPTMLSTEWQLFVGQRIFISNSQTAGAGSQTVRFTYSYNLWTPSA
jgi:hypothetical protein